MKMAELRLVELVLGLGLVVSLRCALELNPKHFRNKGSS